MSSFRCAVDRVTTAAAFQNLNLIYFAKRFEEASQHFPD